MDFRVLQKNVFHLLHCPTCKELEVLLKSQAITIKDQAKKIEELAMRLEELEIKKTSSNSSVPPSKDENRVKANQSLRKPTGKKPGGQKGRTGKTLEMSEPPDEIVELHPYYCESCGSSLQGLESTKFQRRQVVDIPPIKAVYTEYQTFSKECSCGCKTIADFPKGIDVPVSYGSNTEALIGYLHARQYLPFARMQELFNDVFQLPISEGGIHYLLHRFADKTTQAYNTIKEEVAESKVVGSDETGANVNGKKHWFWTWQTPRQTFITHSNNRAGRTINTVFPEGFPNSTLVHDGWKPQLNTPAKNHQSCLPHLQRRLNYLNEKYGKATWGKEFLKLLYDAMELKKKMTPQDYHYSKERILIVHRLQFLLEHPPDRKHKQLFSFYKRMGREQCHLFTFLFIEDVPPDNNASERAIRNVKVKQKVSGQFKVEKAAQNFAKIRSVIDTAIKNHINVLHALRSIADLNIQFAF